MSSTFNFQLLFIIIFIIFLLILVFVLGRTKKIPQNIVNKFIKKIEATKNLDPSLSIMMSHKYFIAALASLTSKKKAAERIKIIADRLPNKAQIRRFHRLRNKIAHEVEINVIPTEANLARKNFIKALESLKN